VQLHVDIHAVKNYVKNAGLTCQLNQFCDIRRKIIRTVELASTMQQVGQHGTVELAIRYHR